MMTTESLSEEQQVYEREKDQLIAAGQSGKYVLIAKGSIIGVWDTYEDALRSAYKQLGLETRFLVKRIEALEAIQFFSRDICRA